jgi:hypothetical protein
MRIEEVRRGLVARLRARTGEIEEAVLIRVYGVSESTQSADPEYTEGLRVAVSAAIDYGLAALERSGERSPPLPTALLAQARLAARNGVKLETVLRRYLAGYTLLGDFVIEESTSGERLNGRSLKRLMRAQATLFDRLIVAISEEYTREAETQRGSSEERRLERVERLLTGELLETSELAYEFDVHHLGVVALGPGSAEAIRGAATALDRRLLLVQPSEATVWAWLGGQRRIPTADFEKLISWPWSAPVSVAIGEQGAGHSGWRLTHKQARAALQVGRRRGQILTRYADVALLASTLQDDLLITSLRQLYLAPLERERDSGAVARKTLRAYFAADRNVSSAAAALGVSRRAVTNRLHAIEENLGRPLSVSAAALEAALCLDELGDFSSLLTDASDTI